MYISTPPGPPSPYHVWSRSSHGQSHENPHHQVRGYEGPRTSHEGHKQLDHPHVQLQPQHPGETHGQRGTQHKGKRMHRAKTVLLQFREDEDVVEEGAEDDLKGDNHEEEEGGADMEAGEEEQE